MTKALNLFFLLLIFSVSTAFSEFKFDPEKYRLFVTKVDPEFHCFELSNNMVFYSASKCWKCEKLPEVGSEVTLIPTTRNAEDKLSHQEEGEFFAVFHIADQKRHLLVWTLPESEKHCLSFIGTKSVCTQPEGWFSSAVYENVMALSDGSQWTVEKDQHLGFTSLDHVIVSKFAKDKWCISDINRTIYIDPNQISSKAKAHYKYAIVKPYIPIEQVTKE